jgi:hypothetical protein
MVVEKAHRIGENPYQPPSPLESATRRIQKFVRLLDLGLITTDEFHDNVLLFFVSMPDAFWLDCAALIPDDLARRFRDYVHAYLVPVDFMPSPRPFMVDTSSETAIGMKKRELRPTYVAVDRFWQSRF